jgi:protein-S-isoprenylcysteine O-methyltransferase Ste14
MERFHILFSATYLGMVFIRMLSWRTTIRAGGKVELRESKLNMAVRAIGGLGYIAALTAYVFCPRYLAWAIFPLPLWARWIGAGVSVGAVLLLAWVQWALGKNFNTTLHVREQHTLITHGPYRWVRHPMYTALFSLGVGWLLLTANGVVGVPLPLASAILICLRVPNEEALMVEQFGDAYRNYMARTGRFMPRLLRGS